MAHTDPQVVQWLHRLGIAPAALLTHTLTLERACANGALIGQAVEAVARERGVHVPDDLLKTLAKGETTVAKLRNFAVLRPLLHTLGCAHVDVDAIATEQRGAAAKLLFSLQCIHAGTGPAERGRRSSSPSRALQAASSTRGSTSPRLKMQREALRVPYAARLIDSGIGLKAAVQELRLAPFEMTRLEVAHKAAEDEAAEEARRLQERDAYVERVRSARLARAAESPGKSSHLEQLRRIQDIERRELALELGAAERARVLRMNATTVAKLDARGGIADIEARMRRQGLDPYGPAPDTLAREQLLKAQHDAAASTDADSVRLPSLKQPTGHGSAPHRRTLGATTATPVVRPEAHETPLASVLRQTIPTANLSLLLPGGAHAATSSQTSDFIRTYGSGASGLQQTEGETPLGFFQRLAATFAATYDASGAEQYADAMQQRVRTAHEARRERETRARLTAATQVREAASLSQRAASEADVKRWLLEASHERAAAAQASEHARAKAHNHAATVDWVRRQDAERDARMTAIMDRDREEFEAERTAHRAVEASAAEQRIAGRANQASNKHARHAAWAREIVEMLVDVVVEVEETMDANQLQHNTSEKRGVLPNQWRAIKGRFVAGLVGEERRRAQRSAAAAAVATAAASAALGMAAASDNEHDILKPLQDQMNEAGWKMDLQWVFRPWDLGELVGYDEVLGAGANAASPASPAVAALTASPFLQVEADASEVVLDHCDVIDWQNGAGAWADVDTSSAAAGPGCAAGAETMTLEETEAVLKLLSGVRQREMRAAPDARQLARTAEGGGTCALPTPLCAPAGPAVILPRPMRVMASRPSPQHPAVWLPSPLVQRLCARLRMIHLSAVDVLLAAAQVFDTEMSRVHSVFDGLPPAQRSLFAGAPPMRVQLSNLPGLQRAQAAYAQLGTIKLPIEPLVPDLSPAASDAAYFESMLALGTHFAAWCACFCRAHAVKASRATAEVAAAPAAAPAGRRGSSSSSAVPSAAFGKEDLAFTDTVGAPVRRAQQMLGVITSAEVAGVEAVLNDFRATVGELHRAALEGDSAVASGKGKTGKAAAPDAKKAPPASQAAKMAAAAKHTGDGTTAHQFPALMHTRDELEVDVSKASSIFGRVMASPLFAAALSRVVAWVDGHVQNLRGTARPSVDFSEAAASPDVLPLGFNGFVLDGIPHSGATLLAIEHALRGPLCFTQQQSTELPASPRPAGAPTPARQPADAPVAGHFPPGCSSSPYMPPDWDGALASLLAAYDAGTWLLPRAGQQALMQWKAITEVPRSTVADDEAATVTPGRPVSRPTSGSSSRTAGAGSAPTGIGKRVAALPTKHGKDGKDQAAGDIMPPVPPLVVVIDLLVDVHSGSVDVANDAPFYDLVTGLHTLGECGTQLSDAPASGDDDDDDKRSVASKRSGHGRPSGVAAGGSSTRGEKKSAGRESPRAGDERAAGHAALAALFVASDTFDVLVNSPPPALVADASDDATPVGSLVCGDADDPCRCIELHVASTVRCAVLQASAASDAGMAQREVLQIAGEIESAIEHIAVRRNALVQIADAGQVDVSGTSRPEKTARDLLLRRARGHLMPLDALLHCYARYSAVTQSFYKIAFAAMRLQRQIQCSIRDYARRAMRAFLRVLRMEADPSMPPDVAAALRTAARSSLHEVFSAPPAATATLRHTAPSTARAGKLSSTMAASSVRGITQAQSASIDNSAPQLLLTEAGWTTPAFQVLWHRMWAEAAWDAGTVEKLCTTVEDASSGVWSAVERAVEMARGMISAIDRSRWVAVTRSLLAVPASALIAADAQRESAIMALLLAVNACIQVAPSGKSTIRHMITAFAANGEQILLDSLADYGGPGAVPASDSFDVDALLEGHPSWHENPRVQKTLQLARSIAHTQFAAFVSPERSYERQACRHRVQKWASRCMAAAHVHDRFDRFVDDTRGFIVEQCNRYLKQFVQARNASCFATVQQLQQAIRERGKQHIDVRSDVASEALQVQRVVLATQLVDTAPAVKPARGVDIRPELFVVSSNDGLPEHFGWLASGESASLSCWDDASAVTELLLPGERAMDLPTLGSAIQQAREILLMPYSHRFAARKNEVGALTPPEHGDALAACDRTTETAHPEQVVGGRAIAAIATAFIDLLDGRLPGPAPSGTGADPSRRSSAASARSPGVGEGSRPRAADRDASTSPLRAERRSSQTRRMSTGTVSEDDTGAAAAVRVLRHILRTADAALRSAGYPRLPSAWMQAPAAALKHIVRMFAARRVFATGAADGALIYAWDLQAVRQFVIALMLSRLRAPPAVDQLRLWYANCVAADGDADGLLTKAEFDATLTCFELSLARASQHLARIRAQEGPEKHATRRTSARRTSLSGAPLPDAAVGQGGTRDPDVTLRDTLCAATAGSRLSDCSGMREALWTLFEGDSAGRLNYSSMVLAMCADPRSINALDMQGLLDRHLRVHDPRAHSPTLAPGHHRRTSVDARSAAAADTLAGIIAGVFPKLSSVVTWHANEGSSAFTLLSPARASSGFFAPSSAPSAESTAADAPHNRRQAMVRPIGLVKAAQVLLTGQLQERSEVSSAPSPLSEVVLSGDLPRFHALLGTDAAWEEQHSDGAFGTAQRALTLLACVQADAGVESKGPAYIAFEPLLGAEVGAITHAYAAIPPASMWAPPAAT